MQEQLKGADMGSTPWEAAKARHQDEEGSGKFAGLDAPSKADLKGKSGHVGSGVSGIGGGTSRGGVHIDDDDGRGTSLARQEAAKNRPRDEQGRFVSSDQSA